MCEPGIAAQATVIKYRMINSQHGFPRHSNLVEQLEIVHPERVWISDITYIRFQREFVYLAVLIDVFMRSIRGWYLGCSLDQSLTWLLLQASLQE